MHANDTYADFSAEFSNLVRSTLVGVRPYPVKPIVPPHDPRLLTKVRHSAFYSTALAYLLNRLKPSDWSLPARHRACILYTALHAYVRHFPVVISNAAVAHIVPDQAPPRSR